MEGRRGEREGREGKVREGKGREGESMVSVSSLRSKVEA